MIIQKNFQMKFKCVIVFLIMDFNSFKAKKNVGESFFTVEYLIITKLIIAEKVIAFGSDSFILCCDCVFYWFDESIDQEFVDCVDEIDDCQRVIHIKNLIMSEPPPTRCERYCKNITSICEIVSGNKSLNWNNT